MPLHDEPIPFFTLPNWANAATQCGFNIEPVFREAGIEMDLLQLDQSTVRPSQLMRAMEACVARAGAQHFPFVLGETFAFDYLPEITTFLNTSSTLREAFRVFAWVRDLINPTLSVQLEERAGKAWLLIELIGAPKPPSPYFLESTFAAILKFGRSLLSTDANFERLYLAYPEPQYAARYYKFFGTPVAFDQPEHALVFDPALLDRPLGGAFPALHQQSEALVERRLTRLLKKAGVVANIERAFSADPTLFGQGLEGMAAVLGLHPRALQRRLQDVGQNYADVQSQARFRLAGEWLQQGSLDLESISERLGFSDRRSFTRAFTRWSGQSPSSFRKKK
ncbi:MAG: AraC family transcriptional regulator [Nevskia sp.]|nr:AraC family transcriptional regulator [Nevskia sp.]